MVGQLNGQFSENQIAYRGRWVLSPDFRLLENTYVVCVDNLIRQVTPVRPDGKIHEHDGLILPGLVNAHTHLEFSDLEQPLGHPGEDFVSWIGQVIAHRNTRDPNSVCETIQNGLSESVRSGTCALGEISTFDWHSQVESTLQVTDFRELIGFRPEQHEETVATAENFLATWSENSSWRPGLSPHAPYSLNKESLEYAVEQSRASQFPLAMHLAETREELELLRNHSGPFFDLLNRLELWTEENFAKETSPLTFLKVLARAHRALVVHGNYLNSSELEYIAAHRDVLSLVYCPRTHAYFRHIDYPLETIRRLEIPLALGTDSRASNPDLSIWNEMKYLFQLQKLAPREVLEMGTINGAVALGLERELGTLQVGKQAQLFLAPPPEQCEFSKAVVACQ